MVIGHNKGTELPTPYLVFSWEHNAFWRPKRCGYTRFIDKAGRYSRDEAEAICRDADYRTNAERKAADPDFPPSEICFPAPEAAAMLQTAAEALKEARLALETPARRVFNDNGDHTIDMSPLDPDVYSACYYAARTVVATLERLNQ